MMISPGYSYSKAPDQEHFLRTQRAHDLFSRVLSNPKRGGGSISRRCSCSSSWASATSNARRGATRPTTSSAGSARAISCRKATRRPSRSCSRPRAGRNYGRRQRQREVPRLHGPLRLRASAVHHTFASVARIPRHGGGHRHRAVLSEGDMSEGHDARRLGTRNRPRCIARGSYRQGVDYRGNVRVVKTDGL
jgi:hypothetical protein